MQIEVIAQRVKEEIERSRQPFLDVANSVLDEFGVSAEDKGFFLHQIPLKFNTSTQ